VAVISQTDLDAYLARLGLELTDALGDHFGLDVSPVRDQAWDALWARVQATHAAWESARRP
jgi:hypothetical protein